jgi:hypothetical protein
MVQVFSFNMTSLSISASLLHTYVYSYFSCQNSRTPGTLVHGGDHPDHGPITIGRVTAGVEHSRPFRPKWSGMLGLIFQVNIPLLIFLEVAKWYNTDLFVSAQHAGARDDESNPIIRDFYYSQLTARSPFSLSYFLGFHMFRHTINIVIKVSSLCLLHCIAVEMLMMIHCLLSLKASTPILGTIALQWLALMLIPSPSNIGSH